MNKKFTTILLFVLLTTAVTFGQGYGLSFKISTLGGSVELARSLSDKFNVKLGASYFSYSLEDQGSETDDYLYDAEANLFSLTFLADYFPFDNAFRLTGGVMVNLNEGNLTLTPTQTYTIGGDVYSPETIGQLNALIDFNKVAPYLGFGLGNPTAGDSGVKFNFDLGTVYQGAPGVGLTADGLLAPSAAPDQEQTLEGNIDWFKWYPVVSFGLTYKF